MQLIFQIVLKLFMDIFSSVGLGMPSFLHSAFMFIIARNRLNRCIKNTVENADV